MFPRLSTTCQAWVRFFAWIELNHMLHYLCGPPSISLSFTLAGVLPRRYTYRVSYDTVGVEPNYIKYTSFTARTTRVSNPVCSPCSRASASVSKLENRFRHRCSSTYLRISPLHVEFRFLRLPSRFIVSNAVLVLSTRISHLTYNSAYAPFTPNKSG